MGRARPPLFLKYLQLNFINRLAQGKPYPYRFFFTHPSIRSSAF